MVEAVFLVVGKWRSGKEVGRWCGGPSSGDRADACHARPRLEVGRCVENLEDVDR